MRNYGIIACCFLPILAFSQPVLVGVSANFALSFDKISKNFIAKNPVCEIQTVPGVSGNLYAQFLQGESFDIVLFANESYAQNLQDQKKVAQLTEYAKGKLVFVTNEKFDDQAPHQSLRKISNKGISIANPKIAPYGKAAEQVLTQLHFSQEKSLGKIAYASDVANAYLNLQQKNVEGAFVSLAQARNDLQTHYHVWMVPTSYYSPIRQTEVLSTTGANNPCAANLYQYILKDNGARAIIKNDGYDLPEHYS